MAEKPSQPSFMEAVRRIRANLQPGGPEVDYSVLFSFLDNELPEADSQEVQRRIGVWEAWHDAYWELRCNAHMLLSLEEGEPDPDGVIRNGGGEA